MTIRVKDILIKPISSNAANELVKKIHYSGKVVNNSVLHFGVFIGDKLEGAMSFGSPMDKKKVLPLVKDTAWNGMLELNRMAFSEKLPQNSESRALSVAFRLIKKHYPHIEWVLSFSDGTQCGDGTIYRASGFVLTQIKENSSLYEAPMGLPIARMTWDSAGVENRIVLAKKYGFLKYDASSFLSKTAKLNGMKPLVGYQLRYIYFLNESAKSRLTVPVIPFKKIDEIGASMYKGLSIKRTKQANSEDHSGRGGVTPTCTLHSENANATVSEGS